jgi:hypothetical protein
MLGTAWYRVIGTGYGDRAVSRLVGDVEPLLNND